MATHYVPIQQKLLYLFSAKDYLPTEKLQANKDFLEPCSSAYSKNKFDMKEKRKIRKKNSAQEVLDNIKRDRKTIVKGIEVVEKKFD